MAWTGRRYGEHPWETMYRWSNEKTKQEHRDTMVQIYKLHGYRRCGDKWVKPTPGTGAPSVIPPVLNGKVQGKIDLSDDDDLQRKLELFRKDAVLPPPPPPNIGAAARPNGREAWEAFKGVPWWAACIWFVLGLLTNEILRAIT